MISDLYNAARDSRVSELRRSIVDFCDTTVDPAFGKKLLTIALQTRSPEALAIMAADYQKLRLDQELILETLRKMSKSDVEFVHRVRQCYHRLPEASYETPPFDRQFREMIGTMLQDGIAHYPKFVDKTVLESLHRHFKRAMLSLKFAKLRKKKKFKKYDSKSYWQPHHDSFVHNDMAQVFPLLLDLASRKEVLEVAAHYLGKPAKLKKILGMRYLPKEPITREQFRWHHDMEDRQFKIMILLTDISDSDQYMTYAKGSHNRFHKYENFLTNKLDFEAYTKAFGEPEIAKTLGKAGDAYLFDSNGMHRGNRSLGSIRDAIFIEYSPDKNIDNIWGTDLKASSRNKYLERNRNVLNDFLKVTPKWRRPLVRTVPTWAHSLPTPELWI